MRDIRCPRCGALLGRVDGKAQLKCRRARCYSIVDVNTHTGKATMLRYGAGTNFVQCHETTSLDEIDDKYYRGDFPQS